MRQRSVATPPGVVRRALLGWIILGLLVPGGLFAADATSPDAASPLGGVAAKFAPGVYRGRLGEHEIQLELSLETNAQDSVEGSYFVFGEGDKILLAGEFEGAHLSMEESRNGKDVSGTWSGDIAGQAIAGVWRNADESVELPFHLTRINVSPPEKS